MLDVFKPYADLIKIALLVVVLALCMYSVIYSINYFDQVGYDRAISECKAEKDEAERKSIENERAMQQKVDAALERSAQREKKHNVELAVLDSRNVRLRDELSTFRNRLSGASISAAVQAGQTVSELFGECVEQYQQVARAADEHAEDALTCREAWPK